MRNRNLLVLIIMVVLIVAVAVVGTVFKERGVTITQDASPLTAETAAPAEANAYLLVRASGNVYEPIPLLKETEYTLSQGEGVQNVIHVTPDSVWMQSSSCENQDCVLQGTVTLDNIQTRVFGNMIICLPNQVTLELLTPEELSQIVTME